MEQLVDLLTRWRTVGWLAGTIGLIQLLINFTKTPASRLFIPPTMRPWLALGLGAVSTALGAVAQHAQPWAILAAAIAGALTGLAATGAHELWMSIAPKNRLERTALMAIKAAVMSGETATKGRLASLSEQLAHLATLGNETERLRALAEWTRRHPVG